MNLGKWDQWYQGATTKLPYGETPTYQMGADFLAGLAVEDWGCGYGHFSGYMPVKGIDGSCSPFADEIADLALYRSETEGIFMRHVLEHDLHWEQVLTNAVGSFTRRMVLVVFTPWAEATEVLTWTVLGVPDIAFRLEDLTKHFVGCRWELVELHTETHYGVEHVFCLEKDNGLAG